VPPRGTRTNDHEKLEGKGKVPEKEPAEVDVREATRADDIFTKLRSEISNAIPTTINSKGRNAIYKDSRDQHVHTDTYTCKLERNIPTTRYP